MSNSKSSNSINSSSPVEEIPETHKPPLGAMWGPWGVLGFGGSPVEGAPILAMI